jgi:hypothetical protein
MPLPVAVKDRTLNELVKLIIEEINYNQIAASE